MGLIARIIDSFTGNDGEPEAKVEMYKNDNANARIFNPPGDDSRPLDGDSCFTEDSEDTEGGKDVLGFIDPKNSPVSEKGEKRLYSRDSAGTVVAVIYLTKDGKIIIEGPGEAITFDLLKHNHLGNLGFDTGPPTITGSEVAPPSQLPSTNDDGDIIDGSGTNLSTHGHEQGNDGNGDTEVKTDGPS